jgi:hypothetical protein
MRDDFDPDENDSDSDSDDGYEDDYDDDHDGQREQPGPVLPWPHQGPPAYPAAPRGRPARAGLLLAITALIATAAGFLIVTAVRDISASPAAAAGPTAAPTAGATPGATPGGGQLPGGSTPSALPTPGSGQVLQLEIGGKVTAVSGTSITLDGAGQQVTATVTKATKVTGRVTSIAGVKRGDLVSAQITGTGGKLTATAIQDPASLP